MSDTEGHIDKIKADIINTISHIVCNEYNKSFNYEKFIKKVIDTIWKRFEKDIFEITTKEFSELLNPTDETLKKEYEKYINDCILEWYENEKNKENMKNWIKNQAELLTND
jgi:hypothetical protein